MLLPELYALPHPNIFKFHVPTSALVHAHIPSVCNSLPHSIRSENTLKHFISNLHFLSPRKIRTTRWAPQILFFFILALYKSIYLLTYLLTYWRVYRMYEKNSEEPERDVASRLPDEVIEAMYLLITATVGFFLNVIVTACLINVRSLRTISSVFLLHGCLLDAIKCLYSVPFATSLLRQGPPNSCAVLGGLLSCSSLRRLST